MKETYLYPLHAGESLKTYHYGMEVCEKGHGFGPAVRDHYLIHFVRRGKGTFQMRGTVYQLQAGEAFLIPAWEVTYYEADAGDPWEYWWIGFHGLEAENLLREAGMGAEQPVIALHGDTRIFHHIEKLLQVKPGDPSSSLSIHGRLCLILAELQPPAGRRPALQSQQTAQEYYVRQALEFIARNYSRPIRINDITRYVGLDRSYFSTLFGKQMQVSPRRYLLQYRMQKAAELLHSTALSVGDVSRSVGYADPFTFSRAFTKIMGAAPHYYRRDIRRKQQAAEAAVDHDGSGGEP